MPRGYKQLPVTRYRYGAAAARTFAKTARSLAHMASRIATAPGQQLVTVPAAAYVAGSRKRKRQDKSSTKRAKRSRKDATSGRTGRTVTYGKWGGPFNKPVRNKVKVFQNSKTIEHRGVITDAQCVYVGCTTSPFNEILRAICRCIVQELFAQMGQPFVSFDSQFLYSAGASFRIRTRYYDNPLDTTVNTMDVAISPAQTFNTIANNLASQFGTSFNVNAPHELLEIYLEDIAATGSQSVVARINCGQFKFTLDLLSHLTLQNQTKASQGDLAQDESEENIENNPLEGKVYSNNSTGFMVKFRQDEVGWDSFIANPLTGVILADSTNNASQFTRKPPHRKVWKDCKYSADVRLEPGEVKKSFVKFVKTYSLQYFFTKYYAIINEPMTVSGNTQIPMYGIGRSNMIGLEKVLDSGASESVISVGWQVTHYIRCDYRHKLRVAPLPIVEIN